MNNIRIGKANESDLPIIGITMGDASGVGAEVIVKALSSKEIYDICRPLVIGDAEVMRKTLGIVRAQLDVNPIKKIPDAEFEHGTIDVLDFNNINMEELRMGEVQVMSGKASLEYIRKAIELALKGEIHAVSTAPINKEAIHKAGSPFPGHTEIFANLTGLTPKDVAMLLIAGKLRVFHVTAHESLRHACELTKKERVLETIKLAHKSLKDLGIEEPKIAVAGLNPHAGEGGLFGDEEIKEIAPAIKLANELGINAIGPFSPDSVFFRASKGEFDGVVAMYHDQGHIPLKLIGFTNGVNVTIGLPIIRTSVDHGTAFGRAGKGYADPTSMSEAIKLAATMSEAKCKHSK